MNLENAQLKITTHNQLSERYWLVLSDYADNSEFISACANLFPQENNPHYIYTSWRSLPDFLINRNWLCPNFFELRNSLRRLDVSEHNSFILWCQYHGFSVNCDDAETLVTHYQDMQGDGYFYNPLELSDEALLYDNLVRTYFDYGRVLQIPEIFDENYN